MVFQGVNCSSAKNFRLYTPEFRFVHDFCSCFSPLVGGIAGDTFEVVTSCTVSGNMLLLVTGSMNANTAAMKHSTQNIIAGSGFHVSPSILAMNGETPAPTRANMLHTERPS